MAKTGKGLPRSLQNVDFGDLDISVGWGEVTGKPAVIAAGATKEAARTAIGAGTSSLAIGTTSTTAMAGNKFVQGAAVTDVGTQTVTGGLEPYSYQWYKNNNAIAGANAASYVKASTTTADSGTYKVVVRDVYGNIISSSTVATVS